MATDRKGGSKPGPKSHKPKKVAIVGFTPTRQHAPWGDPSFEIWGLNALYKYQDCPRFDRWFDVHGPDHIPPDRIAAYASMSIPVYLQEVHPKVPNSVRFPKQELEKALGSRYFTNSISWMVALALAENFEEIHVYGVDMAQDTEYRFQRPNLEYWLGRAESMGRRVYIPDGSDLLGATHQYGFETDNKMRKKLKERLDDLNKRTAGLDQNIQRMSHERQTLEGAKQNLTWMIQSMTVPDSDSMEAFHPDAPAEAVGG